MGGGGRQCIGFFWRVLMRDLSKLAGFPMGTQKASEAAKNTTVPNGNSVDMVNHPPHYQGKVECIDAIQAALGNDAFVAYCRGNVIKYAFRASKKGENWREDLAKSTWYAQRAIQVTEG